MKRIVVVFSILLMFIICVPTVASASSVTFEGEAEKFVFLPGSDYTDTDLFESFKGVMPGDTVTQKITVKNNYAKFDHIKVYLRAIPHNETDNSISPSVSEGGESLVTMSDFLSKLSMTVKQGDKTLFSASPEKLDGLSENVLIGSFKHGEETELDVQLIVPIELGNEYSNRIGEVDWVFTVEGVDRSDLPITGDDALGLLYIAAILSFICLCILLAKRKAVKTYDK